MKYIGQYPDATGHFGPYGGRFVGETLMTALLDVEAAWKSAKHDPAFMAEFRAMLRDYAGRPSPLDYIGHLSDHIGGASLLDVVGGDQHRQTVGPAQLHQMAPDGLTEQWIHAHRWFVQYQQWRTMDQCGGQ